MIRETFEVEHAQALLDVVVGVVIAIPLSSLPVIFESWTASAGKPHARRSEMVKAILLAASLIFLTYYWLETRQFVDDQKQFAKDLRPSEIELPVRLIVGGGLLMILGASCIIAWSCYEKFRLFLVVNAAFWTCDFGGSVILRHAYLRYAAQANRTSAAYGWYRSHIEDPFFMYYGLANVAIFLILLLIDRLASGNIRVRIWIAAAILAVTVVRHVVF
jgi:hypothetical protein